MVAILVGYCLYFARGSDTVKGSVAPCRCDCSSWCVQSMENRICMPHRETCGKSSPTLLHTRYPEKSEEKLKEKEEKEEEEGTSSAEFGAWKLKHKV
mmetsp:Transcript_33734/g.40757  ORF Transcript_33734/g.40757 Transcript_33734/m.40757 type:complete len:97 (+) Transcript_33734:1890-2180(+)